MAYRSSNLKNFSESSAKLSKDEIIEVGGEDMLYEVGFCANHLEFAKILLARGISPNKKSIYGRTGLHHLGINGNKEMYDLYVANGAAHGSNF